MASICWFNQAFASAAASRRVYSPPSSSCHILPGKVLTRSLRRQRALTPSSAIAPRRVSAFSVVAQGVANEEMERRGPHDLLIVGPGVLGRLVAKEWRKEFAETCIVGQTMTADHHEELVKIGITPVLRGKELIPKFPYVIFCAPPSRTSDYPGDVRLALSKWSGEGAFLFTSSSAPYDCDDNGTCDEDSPVVPIGSSPKTDKLLKAEKIVVEAGAGVLRLAGLYKEDRGAHTYWLKKGTVDASPDHILNLIHYEDAASLSVAILKKNIRGRIFLGCDNHPLSRKEVMDLVDRSNKFSKTFVGFTGPIGPSGKKLNNTKTRKEIGWEPKYTSFGDFLGVSVK
uniref:NAD(P)-binding Rossmann-fold superfamily protein n=1 Tax=Kalanchoe fedtschenkoi TaxID=63787 RepID=A0A7N0U8I6_KALFE